MPLLALTSSVIIDQSRRESILKSLSKMTSEVLSKPEDYVMVTVSEGALMMSGTSAPAAMVTVKSIGGITPEKNRVLSQRLCSFLESELGISPQRVYINFFDVRAENWGWNSGTFG